MFSHQASNTMTADTRSLLLQVAPDARATISTVALAMEAADLLHKTRLFLLPLPSSRFSVSPAPGVVTAARNLHHPAQHRKRELPLLTPRPLLHELVSHMGQIRSSR